MSKNASNSSLDKQLINEVKDLRRILNELRNTQQKFFVVPILATDPTNLTNGQIWYNSTSHVLKLRKNGSTVTITTS